MCVCFIPKFMDLIQLRMTSISILVEDIPLCYIIKYTIYVVTVKHNYLLCLQLKVHTWRPVSIKHDHHQAIFIQRLKQYMD